MRNENLEKMCHDVQIPVVQEDIVILDDEHADGLFGGKFICWTTTDNNANC